MPVRYTPPRREDLLPVPGVSLGTAAARIKNWQRDDVLLIAFDPGTAAAALVELELSRSVSLEDGVYRASV